MTQAECIRATSLLTLPEVARYLHVSETTVYRLVDRGRLVVHRIARRLRFHPEDVAALLTSTQSPTQYGRTED